MELAGIMTPSFVNRLDKPGCSNRPEHPGREAREPVSGAVNRLLLPGHEVGLCSKIDCEIMTFCSP